MSIPPGGNNPGFDPYDYTGEGTRNTGNNQGNGETRPLIHSVYEYDGSGSGTNGGDRRGYTDMGSMHFTSPDGRTEINIQNAWFPPGFNFARAFGGGDNQFAGQDGQPQRWGGYNPLDNPEWQGRMPMVSQEAAQRYAMERQNYYLQQQEQQMLSSGLYSQNGPMPNYFSSGYHRGGIPPYYHHHGGREFLANNQFNSGYYPGAQQPGISIGLGRHAFIRIGV